VLEVLCALNHFNNVRFQEIGDSVKLFGAGSVLSALPNDFEQVRLVSVVPYICRELLNSRGFNGRGNVIQTSEVFFVEEYIHLVDKQNLLSWLIFPSLKDFLESICSGTPPTLFVIFVIDQDIPDHYVEIDRLRVEFFVGNVTKCSIRHVVQNLKLFEERQECIVVSLT
jgi:hypothetical protein